MLQVVWRSANNGQVDTLLAVCLRCMMLGVLSDWLSKPHSVVAIGTHNCASVYGYRMAEIDGLREEAEPGS